ncbi:lysoplasmalogenase family protein [Flavobacterium capsici]|uniref:Lysoplasmalogenase family protein n=1 Tax=Flavobacterium capsici TaxID=3075618 RepID=A0AA96F1U7_9FLAO|nr:MULTISPECIES: lysoplasmalogenase family protein [unclassified Flavobacterium]WNM18320.1 lysoplasmalogenase family protein [Flavobacterium sp. PMR2A8]WNM22371.1 lysoplasmalogenase family protein [Flavobacterium sp. PMTSA4]
MLNNNTLTKIVTIIFFVIASVEIIAEYLSSKLLILIFKPLIPIFIIVLYLLESKKRNLLFLLAMLFSIITNVLFIPDTALCLFYGIIAFSIHRILIIAVLFRVNNKLDFIPLLLGTVPFLIVFFYIFYETESIPNDSYFILIIQNILISLIAGLALSNYIMNDDKKNSILLISAFLFVLLQFVVFIEKYFLYDELKQLFRPLAMLLNSFAFFTFYKYIVVTEKSNNN